MIFEYLERAVEARIPGTLERGVSTRAMNLKGKYL